MKIIHNSLSGLLAEVKQQQKDDAVRVAAQMQSAGGVGVPRYTSWVIVSARVEWDAWVEWRLLVGRQRAGFTELGFHVPTKLAQLSDERLAEVRGWIEAAGLAMREGMLAADGELLEGVLI